MDDKEVRTIDFLPTKRGCTKAIYDGRQYHLTKVYVNGNRFWKCSNATCKRSITTDNGDKVIKENQHNPDCPRDVAKYDIIKKLEDLRKQVCRNNEPIQKQYERVVCELEDSGHLVTDVPKFSSIKTALYDARKKHNTKQTNKKNAKRKSSCKPSKMVDYDNSGLSVVQRMCRRKCSKINDIAL